MEHLSLIISELEKKNQVDVPIRRNTEHVFFSRAPATWNEIALNFHVIIECML